MSQYTDFSMGMSPGQVGRVHDLAVSADKFGESDRSTLDDLIFQAAEDDNTYSSAAEKDIQYLEDVDLQDSDAE